MKSLLFIPGNSPAMLQNADIFEADGLIFDLEDAIHLDEKDAARDLLASFFKSFSLTKSKLIIRINDASTPFHSEDIEALITWPIDMIMLPKATYQSVVQLDHLLSKYEKQRKNLPNLLLIPIIEKAISLFEVNQIASHPRVTALLLGGEDLTNELEVERTKEGYEILLARQLIIYAAKAYGKEAIDTPFTSVSDKEGLKADALFAKQLGMNGKACIHPIQIDDVNTYFSPSDKQIQTARRILDAEKQATLEGKGVFSVDGKMVDKPVIERAKKLLEKVENHGK